MAKKTTKRSNSTTQPLKKPVGLAKTLTKAKDESAPAAKRSKTTNTITARSPVGKRKAPEPQRLMPRQWAQVRILHDFVHADIVERLTQAEATMTDLAGEFAEFKPGLRRLCGGHEEAVIRDEGALGVDRHAEDEEGDSEVSIDVDWPHMGLKRVKTVGASQKPSVAMKRASARSRAAEKTRMVPGNKVAAESERKKPSNGRRSLPTIEEGRGESDGNESVKDALLLPCAEEDVDGTTMLSLPPDDSMADAAEALRQDQEALTASKRGRGAGRTAVF
ncbi:hypothetical protein B0A55_08576 [Friedmanniomyces simplex]|uniref:Uncharacterized protein n=1 Tax=Friedmanniomyces simplex TaxID=329884 RepID=A0A4U0WZN0_9PEZI|nr:hypothetical protein B0A55_08576 [Friedmanniomyces simplex]